jgi:hypothetical protein
VADADFLKRITGQVLRNRERKIIVNMFSNIESKNPEKNDKLNCG